MLGQGSSRFVGAAHLTAGLPTPQGRLRRRYAAGLRPVLDPRGPARPAVRNYGQASGPPELRAARMRATARLSAVQLFHACAQTDSGLSRRTGHTVRARGHSGGPRDSGGSMVRRMFAASAALGVAIATLLLMPAPRPVQAAEPDAVPVVTEVPPPPVLNAEQRAALGTLEGLADGQPDAALPWMDLAAGAFVVAATSPAVSDELLQEAQSTLPADASVTSAVVANSRQQLADVIQDIFAGPAKSDAQLSPIFSAHIDAAMDRVVLETGIAPDTMRQNLAARYGPGVVILHLIPGASGGLPAVGGRNVDISPFLGGSSINICTTGFSWRINSTPFMLTAGHCFPTGGTANTPVTNMGTVTNASRETWNSGVGSVPLSGQTRYIGDVALIAIASGKTSLNGMYTGAAGSISWRNVTGFHTHSTLWPGDRFCTSGMKSGEQCNWYLDWEDGTWRYTNGETAHPVSAGTKSQTCIIPGDSGGPAFTRNSLGDINAMGVISGVAGYGGSDYYSSSGESNCRSAITQIDTIMTGFAGSPYVG